MINRPLFFANWKMNHGPSEARAYLAAFLNFFAPHDDRTVAMFPPALSLTTVRDTRANRTDILLGVQNIHSQEKGAFTGENSAPMARDAGARLVLVGHSERRHVFGETNVEAASKTALATAPHHPRPRLLLAISPSLETVSRHRVTVPAHDDDQTVPDRIRAKRRLIMP